MFPKLSNAGKLEWHGNLNGMPIQVFPQEVTVQNICAESMSMVSEIYL